MNISKGIALILICTGLGGYGIAEAGFASKLADTHRFRLSFAGGTMRRNMLGSLEPNIEPNPYVSTWDQPYGFIRAGYGISDRLRVSLDVFGFRQRSDLGDLLALYGAFGETIQGKVLALGPDRSLDATAGYWEGHYARIHDKGLFYLENGNEIGIERSLSLVVRQDLVNSLSCYVGPMYNHFYYERKAPEGYTGSFHSLTSHRDLGAVGGVDAKLFNHVIVSGEGFFTGDWGLTGEFGWEF